MIFNQSNLIAKILQKAKTQASLNVSNTTYGAAWADDTAIAPSKAAVYAKIQTVGGSFAGTMDDITDGSTYVKTHNDFTDALESKLNGIAEGAEVNVQADWNQAGSTADDYIKNKPTIPTVSDVAYDATSWNNNTDAPTKNAVRDKFESLSTGSVPTAWGKYF